MGCACLVPVLRRYDFATVLQYQKLTVCFYIDLAESAIASLVFCICRHSMWEVTIEGLNYFIEHVPCVRCVGEQDGPCLVPALRRYGFAFCIAISKANRLLLYWSRRVGDSRSRFSSLSARHMRSNIENLFLSNMQPSLVMHAALEGKMDLVWHQC